MCIYNLFDFCALSGHVPSLNCDKFRAPTFPDAERIVSENCQFDGIVGINFSFMNKKNIFLLKMGYFSTAKTCRIHIRSYRISDSLIRNKIIKKCLRIDKKKKKRYNKNMNAD